MGRVTLDFRPLRLEEGEFESMAASSQCQKEMHLSRGTYGMVVVWGSDGGTCQPFRGRSLTTEKPDRMLESCMLRYRAWNEEYWNDISRVFQQRC